MIPNDARSIETCHTWTDDVARLVTESDGIREALLENHGLVLVPAAHITDLEAQLTTAHGIEVADFRQVETLSEELSNMTAERDALLEILREVWNQFSIEASDGRRWSGGLSVLKDVQQAIGGEQ